MDVYEEIAEYAVSDERIFEKPGTSYKSTVKFSWESSSYDILLTAYDDSSKSDYQWKILMTSADDPNNPWLIFRLKVNGNDVKGSMVIDNDDPADTAVVFTNGDATPATTGIKYCKYNFEIRFEKKGENSYIEYTRSPDKTDLDAIKAFLNSDGSVYCDSNNDKMKKYIMGEDDKPTDRGEGPSCDFIKFAKNSTYTTMAAMFYYPLLEAYPKLYYWPNLTDKICTWTFRGKAIISSDQSRVDFAYPYSDSTSVDWSNNHTVAKRLWPTVSGWYLKVTNSALFSGYNHFIGYFDGSNFYEYDPAGTSKLKNGVIGAGIPSSIKSLIELSLDDVVVPSTVDVKNMEIKFE